MLHQQNIQILLKAALYMIKGMHVSIHCNITKIPYVYVQIEHLDYGK
jgi:hypothetical protein